MAAVPLSDFYEAVRALVGDGGDPSVGYDFVDAQLNAALRTAVRVGGQSCMAIDPDNQTQLSPGPPNGDTWGWLAVKAAALLVGGPVPMSFRTRALSVTVEASGRRDTLVHLETLLSDLDARGNLCGTANDTTHKGLFATAADFMTSVLPRPPALPPASPIGIYQMEAEFLGPFPQ